MGGEICAFMDAFDAAMFIDNDLETLLREMLPVDMFNDSKQLFEALPRRKTTQ